MRAFHNNWFVDLSSNLVLNSLDIDLMSLDLRGFKRYRKHSLYHLDLFRGLKTPHKKHFYFYQL